MQPDTDTGLISNDTVTESILCKFDRRLVTLNFFCFALTFNFYATSFLNKVVSEPQSYKALVSVKECLFDSFAGITCVLHQVVYLLLLQFVGSGLDIRLFSPTVVCWLV